MIIPQAQHPRSLAQYSYLEHEMCLVPLSHPHDWIGFGLVGVVLVVLVGPVDMLDSSLVAWQAIEVDFQLHMTDGDGHLVPLVVALVDVERLAVELSAVSIVNTQLVAHAATLDGKHSATMFGV